MTRSDSFQAESPPPLQPTPAEVELFLKIQEQEKSHFKQIWKQLFALLMVWANFIFVNLRGTAKRESWVGINRCGEYDAMLTCGYLAASIGLSLVSYRIINKEQAIKDKVVANSQDLRLDSNQLTVLLMYAVFGGFISGAFGMMAGSVFQPVLIDMGVPPSVTSATSIYMVTLSSIASSVMYAAEGQLDTNFALWLSFWNALGSFIGYKQIIDYIKSTGR